jgi:hypothetical protein
MWDGLLEMATGYLRERQDHLMSEFDLGNWPRYDYDQDLGTLVFSRDGRRGVAADIELVGSTSKISGTWLWSWANPSILERVRQQMTQVREYGEAHGLEKLTTAKWPADEIDGWEMTAIAAFVLQAEGAYRSPDEKGALFMLLRDVRRLGDGAPPGASS